MTTLTTDRPSSEASVAAIPTTTYDVVADLLVRLHPHVSQASVRPDATLSELDIDSLSLMEFVFAIEDRFQVRIPEQHLDVRQADLTLHRVCEAIDAAVVARGA